MPLGRTKSNLGEISVKKQPRNEVTASAAFHPQHLRAALSKSDRIEVVERRFCAMISQNTYGIAGDRDEVKGELEAVLQRLGDRATPRMLVVFEKHVGKPFVLPSLETTETVSAAPAKRKNGKKARKVVAKPPETAASDKPKSIKLGDRKAEAVMRERCIPAFGCSEAPAFFEASPA